MRGETGVKSEGEKEKDRSDFSSTVSRTTFCTNHVWYFGWKREGMNARHRRKITTNDGPARQICSSWTDTSLAARGTSDDVSGGGDHSWGHRGTCNPSSWQDAPQQDSNSEHAHNDILRYSRKIQFWIDIDFFYIEKPIFSGAFWTMHTVLWKTNCTEIIRSQVLEQGWMPMLLWLPRNNTILIWSEHNLDLIKDNCYPHYPDRIPGTVHLSSKCSTQYTPSYKHLQQEI